MQENHIENAFYRMTAILSQIQSVLVYREISSAILYSVVWLEKTSIKSLVGKCFLNERLLNLSYEMFLSMAYCR